MLRHRIKYLLFVLLAASQINCRNGDSSSHSPFTRQSAVDIFEEYTRVLTSGDTADVLSFWSVRSKGHPDFWNLHAYIGGRIPFPEWPAFLTSYTSRVEEVRHMDRSAIIDLTWILNDASDVQNGRNKEMRYYVIHENNRWVFINPIDHLTQDWASYESEQFIYHFPPEIRVNDHLHEISANDQSFQDMLRFFELEPTGKIPFYVSRSTERAGELMLQPPANGYAVLPLQGSHLPPEAYRVISTSFYHPHEVAHCVAALAGIPYNHPVITEGFAVVLGGVTTATAELTLIEARNLLETSKLLPLETLFTLPVTEFLQKNYITYYESGALIRFLHDRYGLSKLMEISAALKQPSDIEGNLEHILGESISRLEKQFHDYLSRQNRENIGFSIPPAAVEVFSMSDPEHDDTGDGDYVYPKHTDFAKGVFDLRRFAVLKDNHNAFFRITMSQLTTPVSYGSSDEQFTPCIVIAINYGDTGKRSLQHKLHGVHLPAGEGYDVKLNIGSAVSLSNNLGKVFYTTPDIVYDFISTNDRSIEISIPKSIIGEPDEDWRYFVGIGLTSNRTMNFLYNGPMPVMQNHPVFISGGNFTYGNPGFIDILYPDADEQEQILGEYDVDMNIVPVVKMVEPP